MTQFRGFELFDDIADVALRARNRAVVLANIFEDNSKNRLISPKGAGIVLGYFNAIPEQERATCKDIFTDLMTKRGYVPL